MLRKDTQSRHAIQRASSLVLRCSTLNLINSIKISIVSTLHRLFDYQTKLLLLLFDYLPNEIVAGDELIEKNVITIQILFELSRFRID